MSISRRSSACGGSAALLVGVEGAESRERAREYLARLEGVIER